MSALELGRLFSLMEGVDPEGLFTAALRMSTGAGGGGMLDAALGGTGDLTPALAGMEGLPASQMEDGGLKSGVERSGGGGDADEGAASTDGDSRGSVGGTGGAPGGPAVPPRTGAINDCKCTKVLPASSSAPKYKFVVPNEYVYKFMQHLVERPFHMRDPTGKLWDCVLIQRKNKEKYEYMIQGWRRFGESTGVQEGDTVTIEMVDDAVMQLTIERGAAGIASARKRPRTTGQQGSGANGGGGGGGGGMTGSLVEATERHQQLLREAAQLQAAEVEAEASRGVDAELLQAQLLAHRAGQQQQQQQQAPQGLGLQQAVAQQQQQQQFQQGGGASRGLLALLQQQQAVQQAAQQAAVQQAAAQQQQQQQQQAPLGLGMQSGPRSTPPPPGVPRSLTQHLANGLSGSLGAAGISEAQLAAVISSLEKQQQRLGEGAPGSAAGQAPPPAPAAGSGGAPVAGAQPGIRLLSDVADIDALVQENMGLREELRMAQAKIATLETGVLNIKSVLTRNTDPGLIAMTGVINLLNQMESPDFLPELGTIGRMTLTGLCSEVRRHLNGVLRMVWILRSLPDDVQQHNMSGGAGPGANSGQGP